MEKYKFNISYSAMGLFKGCQRSFYYTHVAKMPPERTINCYGDAGTIVHTTIENYYGKSIEDAKVFFDAMWEDRKLSTTNVDAFNRTLGKEKYWNSVLVALGRGYDINHFEEKIQFEDFHKIKGFIDVVANLDGIEFTPEESAIINSMPELYEDVVIIDWKTSSKSDEALIPQLHFYAYLYYRKHNKLPKKFILDFVKINKKIEVVLTMKDVNVVAEKVQKFVNDIYSKKSFDDWTFDKTGNYKSSACFFCPHKEKCRKYNESLTSTEEEKFKIVIGKNGKFKLGNPTTALFDKVIGDYFSYQAVDEEALAHIIRRTPRLAGWDGKKNMKKYGAYPIGLLNLMIKYIGQYATATKKMCPITIEDFRETCEEVPELNKSDSSHTLRDYQEEAVATALRKQMGILALSVGAGKTTASAEIYRRNPVNTLFIIDRKVLVTQSMKEYSEHLGIPVEEFGTITEGEMNIPDGGNIVFATIQTLARRVAQKDKCIISYLRGVKMVISDECQINRSKSYDIVFKNLPNAIYRFGLSGTPPEDDNNFLELIGHLGEIIYRIPSKELIDAGILAKPTIRFLRYEHGFVMEGNFNDYKEQLFACEDRNRLIIDLVNKHSGEVQLILVDRIAHGELLQKQLKDAGHDTFFIKGDVTNKQREIILEDARNHHTRVLIGTISIVSRGLNIKPLSNIINATGNANSSTTVQILGRGLRIDGNNNEMTFYDFYDIVKYFREHTQERIDKLMKEGHTVMIDEVEE